MNREWKVFLTAIQFLTRIRVPASIDHRPEYLQQAPRYFPVVGWIVGALSALFFLLFARYVSTEAGIIASMVTSLLITGAFHEDGFADVCDGFGGGWTREKILLIMKDSRIGAFGAIGLIMILGSKFALLRELPGYTLRPGEDTRFVFYPYRYFNVALIAAHSVSRLMAVLVMQMGSYVGEAGVSKSIAMTGRRLSPLALVAAVVFALAPFAFLPWMYLLVVVPALLVSWQLYGFFRRWIGGYTGDCLGATQQVAEITIYLGFVLVWRYF